jgi:AcrR family transcriptional regulator
MAMTTTSSPRGEEKRERIRKAAFRAFRDNGYHETTVDEICRRAGISKGSFYWHFPSKQEIFLEILDTWSREVTEEMTAQFDSAVNKADPISAIGMALQRESHRGRSIVPLWLEFTVYSRRDPEIQSALAKFFGRIRKAIADLLRPAVGEMIRPNELEALAATVFGAYSGLMIQELCDPLGADSADTIRRFVSVLKQGIETTTAQTLKKIAPPTAA